MTSDGKIPNLLNDEELTFRCGTISSVLCDKDGDDILVDWKSEMSFNFVNIEKYDRKTLNMSFPWCKRGSLVHVLVDHRSNEEINLIFDAFIKREFKPAEIEYTHYSKPRGRNFKWMRSEGSYLIHEPFTFC